jgi:hypothetical protein
MLYVSETKMHKHYLSSVKMKLLCRCFVLILSCMSILVATGVTAQDTTVGDLSNVATDGSNIDSNNSQETVTNNYNATGAGSPAPVMSAIAPTVMGGGGNDSCLMPKTMGLSLSIVGLGAGATTQDEACNRRKDARLLGAPQTMGGLGLQVSAISVLCSSPQVFKAMMLANTPCPIMSVTTGKLLMGADAVAKYREKPEAYIVGYADDKAFWDALLRIGEDLQDEQVEATASNVKRQSLSEQFRRSIK